MKHKYTKPAYQFVNIQLNDLCVGSRNAVIDVKIMEYRDREKYSKSYLEGKTNDMWETNF